MTLESFLNSLNRKKGRDQVETRLPQYLTTFNLVSIGIGSTASFGVFVIAGLISKFYAGPSAILSFVIAAFASSLAGLCFSEFGTRIPKAGSSYSFAVTILGEFVAFQIGSNLIQEYAIVSAIVAKGISGHIEAVAGNATSSFFIDVLKIDLSSVDIVAFIVVILISLLLAFKAALSAKMNDLFAVVKLKAILFILVVACFKIDFKNWSIPSTSVLPGFGTGGFFPYGVYGVMKGAALCFSAFSGFENILSAAEEVKNPKKSIPRAIFWTLSTCLLIYVAVTASLTLMAPYYELDTNVPLSRIFHRFGWEDVFKIFTVISILGMICSLIGSFFALPRIFYAMAEDGLFFEIFAVVHPKFKSPVYGILIAGLLTALLAAFVHVKELMKLISLGSILSHSAVAICVILIRYEVANEENIEDGRKGIFNIGFNMSKISFPTKLTAKAVSILTFLHIFFCFEISIFLTLMEKNYVEPNVYILTPLVITILCAFANLYALSSQPKSEERSPFSVPFLPWIPALSIMINIFFLIQLGPTTLIRFVVGIVVSNCFYFIYSRKKSRISENNENRLVSEPPNRIDNV